MEENELYDRIGETDLNPTYKDGQTYQHTDINQMLGILKTAINENYYDIQRLLNGAKTVGNANQLEGATLSRYIDETLQADDNKVPSSQQAKAYMDELFAGYSAPVRGEDYWTDADKEEIIDDTATAVVEEITPSFEEALAAKANINDIPTKISDLQNDSDFLSENNLQMVNTVNVQNGSQISDATGYGRLNKIYGDTQQNGTPTPDIPVDINVVTGDIDISVSDSNNTSEQTYTLPLGDIELCKIDNYQDYIYYYNSDWYYHKEILKLDLSDITNWGLQSAGKFYRTNFNIVYGIKSGKVFSNIFDYSNVAWSGDYKIGITSSNNLWVTTGNSTLNTSNDLSAWLENKNAIMYGVLSTPSDIKITDVTLTNALNEIRNFGLFPNETNFVITGDILEPKLNITYAITDRDIYSKEEVDDLLDNLSLKTKDYYFNSVSEMRAALLKIGNIAITTGYHSSNDGGGSKYKIVENNLLTDDGGSVIELNNGYKAILIVENDTINVKQFGAYGDNIHDDTIPIQNALKFRGNDYLKIVFNENDTYLMQGYIDIYSNTDIILNNSTVKDCYTGDGGIGHHNGLCFRSALSSVSQTGYGGTQNINIKGGTLDGGRAGLMFAILHGENIEFNNIYFHNCFVGTHIIDLGGCKNIRIKNSIFYGNMINNSESAYREMIQPDYARYSSANYWGDDTSIIGYDDLPTEGLIVENCTFEKGEGIYYPNAIGTHATGNLPHKDIVIKNCNFYECYTACIRIPKVVNLLVENNNFYAKFIEGRGDTYAINLVALTEDTYNTSSSDINIINNRFYLNMESSRLIGIGIKGVSDFDYSINNITIKDNYFEGNFDSDDPSIGNDGMHLSNVKNVTVDNNKFNKVKNSVFKSSGGKIDNISLLNNTMHFCREFTRGGDNAANEKLQTTNVFESNNIWTDANGTINLNDFKVIITLDENSTIENSRIVWGQSDSNFIYVNENNKNQIIIPRHIHRFKLLTQVFTTPNESGLKELRGWINYSDDSYNMNANQQYLQGNSAQFLNLPCFQFKRQSMISVDATATIATTLTNNDTLHASHISNYLGTCVIIEGY